MSITQLRVTPTGVLTVVLGIGGLFLVPVIVVPVMMIILAGSVGMRVRRDGGDDSRGSESLIFASGLVLAFAALLAFVLMPSPFLN